MGYGKQAMSPLAEDPWLAVVSNLVSAAWLNSLKGSGRN